MSLNMGRWGETPTRSRTSYHTGLMISMWGRLTLQGWLTIVQSLEELRRKVAPTLRAHMRDYLIRSFPRSGVIFCEGGDQRENDEAGRVDG